MIYNGDETVRCVAIARHLQRRLPHLIIHQSIQDPRSKFVFFVEPDKLLHIRLSFLKQFPEKRFIWIIDDNGHVDDFVIINK